METKLSVDQQVVFFEEKAQYMEAQAKDAAALSYWALAKFARNESAIARAEIRGLKAAMVAFKASKSH